MPRAPIATPKPRSPSSAPAAAAEIVHVNRWLEAPRLAEQFQILCLPGGFSYGDDVAAGRIFGNQLRHHLADALAASATPAS